MIENLLREHSPYKGFSDLIRLAEHENDLRRLTFLGRGEGQQLTDGFVEVGLEFGPVDGGKLEAFGKVLYKADFVAFCRV